jgi:hypothetical protein
MELFAVCTKHMVQLKEGGYLPAMRSRAVGSDQQRMNAALFDKAKVADYNSAIFLSLFCSASLPLQP